ncbi:MAG TPA: hypothetical protein VJ904_09955, partial [Tichowtungia sp.]|nr:hypothetical protein [Tichowtungia sp.]
MKITGTAPFVLTCISAVMIAGCATRAVSLHNSKAGIRKTISFNDNWRFDRFGIMPDGSEREEPDGLELPAFDDSDWRQLDIPHDWGIEGPFRAELPNNTGKLPWAGIGWYRKTFELPEADSGKKIFIDFDGAMSDSTIYLNGKKVGGWPYGYASFRVDLTDAVQFGEKNVLAVRLDNKPESSRWYPGGGIYRNVRLVKTAPVHVDHWGITVTTPQVSASEATVAIQTQLAGADDATEVIHEIIETGDKGSGTDTQITVSAPLLWDVETPNLYTLKTTVKQNGKTVDTVETSFGIRTIEYHVTKGFLLN